MVFNDDRIWEQPASGWQPDSKTTLAQQSDGKNRRRVYYDNPKVYQKLNNYYKSI
jgi:hypothetical protein